MNPEAGFIQGVFRARVESIARANPTMPAAEVIRMARGDGADGRVTLWPSQTTQVSPVNAAKPESVALEFEF